MASDATMLVNDPVTPAHKFVWRAFRGFVYGSPDSSPEHTQTAARPEQGDRMPSSPSRRSPRKKRVSMAPPPTATASLLSPQKRKRDSLPLPQSQTQMLSPTKSILRTPGAAPTPRAKSMRDVNVKFKSVSPEARSGSGSIPILLPRSITLSGAVSVEKVEDLEKQVDELWEELEQSLVEGGSPPRLEVEKRKAKHEKRDAPQTGVTKLIPEHPPKGVGQVDHEEYARRTEREVKRLLRQHKKLRDYAQRADEQNMELNAMVEELRKENSRLKTKLEKADTTASMKREVEPEGISKHSRQDDDKKVTARQNQDRNGKREKAEEVGKAKADSFERSLRGSLASFNIHEDDAQSYKPDKNMKAIKSTTAATVQARSPPKKRSSTTPDLPPSHPETNKEPLVAPKVRPTGPSQSLRGIDNNVLNLADSKASASSHRPTQPPTTTHRRATTHNPHSPFSLTALAAQLEPTPRPPAAAATTSTSTATASNNDPFRSTTLPTGPAGLNMAPDRVAAARARLQAKRKVSGVSAGGGAYYGTATNDASGNANGGGAIAVSMNLDTATDVYDGAGASLSGVDLFGSGRHLTTTMVLEKAMAKDFGLAGGNGAATRNSTGSGRDRRSSNRAGGGGAIGVAGGGGSSHAAAASYHGKTQQHGVTSAQVFGDESALDWAKI